MDTKETAPEALSIDRMLTAAAHLTGESERYMMALWQICMRAHEGNRQRALITFLTQCV